MKFLACFLVLALAQAVHFSVGYQPKAADKEFLVKQKGIFDLLYHANQFRYSTEYVPAEEFFTSFKNSFTKPEVFTKFLQYVRHGLTPKHHAAPVASMFQSGEAKALYYLFFYAKDYETFYKTAKWARDNVNEYIFVYSLTLAVRHRPDTREFVLPASYEIFPFMYTNADVFYKTMRVKTEGYVIDPEFAQKYGGIYSYDEHTYAIANNFTYDFNDDEEKLSYFTNDVSLNYDYYNFHILYPFWLGGEEFGMDSQRRGEIFYYVHQQLLARYTLERFANGLGHVSKFSWKHPIKTGYNPNTVYSNGVPTPHRDNFYDITEEYNAYDLDDVEDYERRIRDAIYNGYVKVFNGTKYPLYKPEDIENLGNFIQGNPDFGYLRYYKQFTTLAKFLLGGGKYSGKDYVPSALEQYYTTTRDPMFYQFYSRVLHYFYRFKDNFHPYTEKELFFDGVRVNEVKFTPLTTFFENFEFDISNGVYQSKEEMESHKDKFTFYASQSRLNHVPFSFSAEVTSDKDTDATVRVFLGPKYDGYGRKIELNDNRFNFIEMDFFKFQLKSGKNTIHRKSSEFAHTSQEQTSAHTMYKQFADAIAGKQEYFKDQSATVAAWPYNLVLPKGSKAGREYQVFFVVTPYQPSKTAFDQTAFTQKYCSGVSSEGRFYEDLPFGFPFDRTIDESTFFTPNIFHTDVTIYHKQSESPNATYKPFSYRGKKFE